MNNDGTTSDSFYVGIAHPFSKNQGNRWFYASSGDSADIACCCGDETGLTSSAGCSVCSFSGISCSYMGGGSFSTGQWIKVEFYVKKNDTCSVAPHFMANCQATSGECSGCTDIARVWINGTVKVSRDNANVGTYGTNAAKQFRNFWLFGNGSNSSNSSACDETVYMDDICIDNGTECTGGVLSKPTNLTIAAPRILAWTNNATGNDSVVVQRQPTRNTS
jgi:hypothetical protein